MQQPILLIPLGLHFSTRGHTDNASCTHTSSYKLLTGDEGAQASRQPAESHLDILHAQDVPTVIHVLLKVFVLEERKGVRAGTLQAHKLQQLVSLHTPHRVMNNNNVKYFNLSIPAENIVSHAGGRLQRFCWSHQVFKHQCERLVCVDDVVQRHDVAVLQVLQ